MSNKLRDGFYFIRMNDHRDKDKRSYTIAQLINAGGMPLWYIIGERDEIDTSEFEIIVKINEPEI